MNAKKATTVVTAEMTLVVAIEATADSMTVVVTVEEMTAVVTVVMTVEEMTVGLMAEAVEIPIKMVATGFVHVAKMTILPAVQFVIVVKQSVQREWAAMVEIAVAATGAIVEEVIVDSMTVVATDEVATVEETEAAGIPIKMTVTGFVHVVKMTILPEGQNVTDAKPHAQAAVQVEVETVEVETVVEVEISETVVETVEVETVVEVEISETVVEVEISETVVETEAVTVVETEAVTAEIAETKMVAEIPM
jgi:hypothetical protein